MDRIQATEVLCDSDDETHWAQWLWPHGGIDLEQGYLVLERPADSEDEFANRVWASRCGQSYSCYDGVEEVLLRRSAVEVKFNNRGKERLGCDDFCIEFSMPDAEFARLVEVLERLLTDCAEFVKPSEAGAASDLGN